MVSALGRDDLSELEHSTSKLIVDDAELLYPALAETATAIAEMVRARAGESGQDTAFRIDVADEYGAVDIDELPPALRALLRAVLALLESQTDDARFQLAMAAGAAQAKGRLDALVHGLVCTSSLLDEQPDRTNSRTARTRRRGWSARPCSSRRPCATAGRASRKHERADAVVNPPWFCMSSATPPTTARPPIASSAAGGRGCQPACATVTGST